MNNLTKRHMPQLRMSIMMKKALALVVFLMFNAFLHAQTTEEPVIDSRVVNLTFNTTTNNLEFDLEFRAGEEYYINGNAVEPSAGDLTFYIYFDSPLAKTAHPSQFVLDITGSQFGITDKGIHGAIPNFSNPNYSTDNFRITWVRSYYSQNLPNNSQYVHIAHVKIPVLLNGGVLTGATYIHQQQTTNAFGSSWSGLASTGGTDLVEFRPYNPTDNGKYYLQDDCVVPLLTSIPEVPTICGTEGMALLQLENIAWFESKNPTYQWYKGTTAVGENKPTLDVTEAGDYKLKVTTTTPVLCIRESAPITVDYDPAANIVAPVLERIAENGLICAKDGSVLLRLTNETDYTNGEAFQWLKDGYEIAGATDKILIVQEAGAYRLAVMDAAGDCVAMSPEEVIGTSATQIDAPILAKSPNASVLCGENGVIRLTVSNANLFTGATYTWFKGSDIVQQSAAPDYIVTEAGSYFVYVALGTCSAASATETITQGSGVIAEADVEVISGSQTLCDNGVVVFYLNNPNAYAAPQYQWYKDGGAIAGANDIMYTATTAGSYYLQIIDGTCMVISDTFDVTDNPTGSIVDPEYTVVPPTLIGIDPVVVTFTNTGDYQAPYATWFKGTTILAEGVNSLEVTVAGVYKFMVTDGDCTVWSEDIEVEIENCIMPATPQLASIPASANICTPGSSVLLQLSNHAAYAASGTVTYQWYKDGATILGATQPTYETTEAGDYKVKVAITLPSACHGYSSELTVTKDGTPGLVKPEIERMPENGIICDRAGSVLLRLTNENEYVNGEKFQWLKNGFAITGATSKFYVATEAAVYRIVVQDLASGCAALSTEENIGTSVTQIEKPTLAKTPDTNVLCGNDGIIRLTVSNANLFSGGLYTWFKGSAIVQQSTAPSYVVTEPDSYFVHVAVGTCSSVSYTETITQSMTAVTVPDVEVLSGSQNICDDNGSNGVVVFRLANANFFANPSYQWYRNNEAIPDANDIMYTATTPGYYYLQIVSLGCAVVSETFEVTNDEPGSIAKPKYNVFPEIIQGNNAAIINFTNPGDYTNPQVTWFRGVEILGTGNSLSVLAPGTYRFLVTDGDCTIWSDEIEVDISNCTMPATPILVSVPSSGNVCTAGSTVLLRLENIADFANNNPTYQWYRGSTLITGATTPYIEAWHPADYRIKVTITTPVTCSDYSAPLTVTQDGTPGMTQPKIERIAKNGVLCNNAGSALLRLTNETAYTNGETFQWLKNGYDMAGVTDKMIIVDEPGSYRLIVLDATGECAAMSLEEHVEEGLGVINTPVLAKIPAGSNNVLCGEHGTIRLTVTNTEDYPNAIYTWFNGLDIVQQGDSPSYTVTEAGSYFVYVASGTCSAASATEVITQGTATIAEAEVDAYPSSLNICSSSGSNGVVVLVLANADDYTNATYQWYRNNASISGATDPLYSANTTGSYHLQITEGNCATISETFRVTNNPGSIKDPVITVTNDGLVVGVNPVELSLVNASDYTGAIKYQWFKENTPVASTPTYATTEAGIYKLLIEVNDCAAWSNEVLVRLSGCYLAEMELSVLPASQNICGANGSVFMTLLNMSDYTAPVTYQWYKDGASIPNANKSYYEAFEAGTYKLYLQDAYCADFSQEYVVTKDNSVIAPVEVRMTPASGVVCGTTGSVMLLMTNPGSYTNPTYQWYKDGQMIIGATERTLEVFEAGSYRIQVTTAGGCGAMSLEGLLEVTENPSINPVVPEIASSGTKICGNNGRVIFYLTNQEAYAGYTEVMYQWFRNNILIGGATDVSYEAQLAGTYRLQVQADGCTALSTGIAITADNTVVTIPQITAYPSSMYLCGEESSVLLMLNNEDAYTAPEYQWFKNGLPITGATEKTYEATEAATYKLQVKEAECTALSANQVVRDNAGVEIEKPLVAMVPSSGNICGDAGAVILTLTNAADYANATYQWLHDNAPIPGANSTMYIARTAGEYRIYVEEGVCGAYSTPETIELVPGDPDKKPIIASLPASNTICGPNGSVQLSVENNAIYTAPVTYIWYRGETVVQNGAMSLYEASVAGDYFVQVVEGEDCSYLSDDVTLTTDDYAVIEPQITTDLTNNQICANDGSALIRVTNQTSYLVPVYQWMKDGAPIAGANNPIYIATEPGLYHVRVTDGDCAAQSQKIQVNFNGTSQIAKPIIATNPDGGIIPDNNGMAYLSVQNTNAYTGAVTYVWYFENGQEMKRSAEPFFLTGTPGTYFVQVIVNSNCSSVSDPVDLILSMVALETPVIAANPESGFICGANGSVVLTLTNPDDFINPTYEWRRNYFPIEGANELYYIATEAGDYTLVVSDEGGYIASNRITVTQTGGNVVIPTIVKDPDNVTLCKTGGGILMQVGNLYEYDPATVVFNWYHNGAKVAEGTYYIAEAEGIYFVQAIEGFCGAISTPEEIRVLPGIAIAEPEVTYEPASLEICGENGAVSFLVTNTAAYATPTFQWYKDGTPITVNGSESFYMAETAGAYFVKVTSGTCVAFSDIYDVQESATYIAPLQIAMTPADGTIYVGSTVKVEIANTADYSAASEYVWFRSGVGEVQRGAESVLTTDVPGSYFVEVIDGDCMTYATFELFDGSEITATIEGSTTICDGGNATLTINITGGVAPWEVVYTTDGGATTITLDNIMTSPHSFVVDPTTTTTYQLVSVTESMGGENLNLTSSAVVTVNPIAEVTNLPDNYTICSGGVTIPVTFLGTGTEYYWQNTGDPIIGMPTNLQTGNFGTYTLTNQGNAPLTAIITVTPKYTGGGVTCEGTPSSFEITVNPMPTADLVFNQEFCTGETVPTIEFTGVATGFTWIMLSGSDDIGSATSGTDSIPSFTALNTTGVPQTANYEVTPIYKTGDVMCYGAKMTFSITVNPNPAINAVADQNHCHGDQVPALGFSSNIPGATFTWERIGGTSIPGLPESGTGAMPAFTASNTGITALAATYRVESSYSGATMECGENHVDFIITVLPQAVVDQVGDMAYCAGETVPQITFTGKCTVFEWVKESGSNIGSPQSGTYFIPEFEAVNTTAQAQTATFAVTPVFIIDGVRCEGAVMRFNITVNPMPTIESVEDKVYCHNTNVPSLNFESNVNDAVYTWNRISGVIPGLPASGIGAMPAFTATNTGTTVLTAVYEVSVAYDGTGCVSQSVEFSISVLPLPRVDLVYNQTHCANNVVPTILFGGVATEFTWRMLSGSASIGSATTGVDSIATFIAQNTTAAPAVATYEVTPWYVMGEKECSGEAITFTITVIPGTTISDIEDQAVCADQTTLPVTFAGVGEGVIYRWTNSNPAIGLPASGTGNIPSFTATNHTANNIAGIITVTTEITGGGDCENATTSFTITVAPTPSVINVTNFVYCNDEEADAFDFEGLTDPAYTVYQWSRTGGADLGLPVNSGENTIPAFTAVNNGNEALMASYQVTPYYVEGGMYCPGETKTFTIVVNPAMVLYSVDDQTYCHNDNVPSLNFASNAPDAIYAWNRVSGDPIPGLPANGTGPMPAFTANNTGAAALVATYGVTASFNGSGLECGDNYQEFTITILPQPTVDPVYNQNYCATEMVPEIVFTGNADRFEWNITTSVNIGAPMSGVNTVPSFTAINATNAPLTATFKVVPVYESNAIRCEGEAMFFDITVIPGTTISDIDDQTVCAGDATLPVVFSGVGEGVIYRWTNSNPAIGLPASGTGNIPSFTATNHTANNIAGIITVTTEITGGGDCENATTSFTITVAPTPSVINVTNFVYCNDEEADAFDFEGLTDPAYTVYQWSRTGGADLGLPVNSGENTIPAFTAVNNGNEALMASYQVTPYYVEGGMYCPGETKTFTIVVNPAMVLYSVDDQTYCHNDNVPSLNFTSNAPDATFTWIRKSGDPIPGLPANGTGPMPAFTANNTGATALVATYGVTASFNGSGLECGDNYQEFTITILPQPTVAPVYNQNYCATEMVPEIVFTGNADRFEWNITTSVNIGAPMSGVNTVPSFTAINNTNASLTATFKVVPVYEANGIRCEGEAMLFDITVIPNAAIDDVADKGYCHNEEVPELVFTGGPENAVYTWSRISGNVIPGLPNNGTGSMPAFTATNNGITQLTATYRVEATYQGETCGNSSVTFRITVFPNVTVDQVFAETYCADEIVPEIVFTGNANRYEWSITTGVNIGAPASGVDMIPSFTAINNTNEPITATFRVVPVYAVNSLRCEGEAMTFDITVIPNGAIDEVADRGYCNGDQVPSLEFTGGMSNVVYVWSKIDGDAIPNLPASGTGAMPAFTATNNGTTPLTATYKVEATYQGEICGENSTEFNITVFPKPTVTPMLDQTYCHNADIDAIIFSGNATYFRWNIEPGSSNIGSEINGVDSIPAFTATNIGQSALTATYKVVPVFEAEGFTCEGDAMTFSITIEPDPVIYMIESQVVCNEGMTLPINFMGSVENVIYRWTNDKPIIGLQAAGNGNIPSFEGINPTYESIVATITVTTEIIGGGVCEEATTSFTITVLPTANVTNAQNFVFCDGDTFEEFTFVGDTDPAKTTYKWNRTSGAEVGLTLEFGENVIPEFTAENTTSAPLMASYVVTPIFYEYGIACEGTPEMFTIVVNPKPTMDPVADQVYCDSADVPELLFSSDAPDAIFAWTKISGDIIEGLPASGYGNMPAFVASNETSTPKTATYKVTASFTGSGTTCGDESQEFDITILPRPTVDFIANKDYCKGAPTETITITGTGTTYQWVLVPGSDNIGSPTNGVNVIPSFTTVNNGITSLTATYEITPIYIYNGYSCPGTPSTFSISVHPTPSLSAVANQTVCVNEQVQAIHFNGPTMPEGTIVTWTNTNSNIGLPSSGAGDIAAFKALNATGAPITATITAIPSYNGCTGSSIVFTITVNPIPEVNPIMNQNYCAGDMVQIDPFSGSVASATYTWSFVEGSYIGLDQTSGTGNFPTFEATNDEGKSISARYKVTANVGDCASEAVYFTITVHPKPVLYTIEDKVYCSNTFVESIQFGGNVADLLYTWTRISGDVIPNLPEAGTGAMPSFTTQNDGDQPLTAKYQVVATIGTCSSDPITFSIMVMPKPTVEEIANIAKCAGEEVDVIMIQGMATSFKWELTGDHVGLLVSSGYDVIPSFITVNDGLSDAVGTITVTPIYTYEGMSCDGDEVKFTITVRPTPQLLSVTDAGAICSGADEMFEYTATSNVAAAYSWERPAIAGVNGGEAGSGTGNVIREALTNETSEPITVVYQFTLTYNGCFNSEPYEVTVVVNPSADVELSQTETLCPGTNEAQVVIPATINNAVEYTIAFTEASIIAGFENIGYYKPVTGDHISFDIPTTGLEAGVYGGTATFRTAQGCIASRTFRFSVASYASIVSQTADESDKLGLCEGETAIIEATFNVNQNDNLHFVWYNNGAEVGSGTIAGGETTVTLEVNEPGTYWIEARGERCGEELRTRDVRVEYNGVMIEQKWDNVLLVSNYGGSYIAYQWYKDGVPIAHEGDAQYYVEPGGLDQYSIYHVVVTLADGSTQTSCPHTPVVIEPEGVIKIYPNPIAQNGQLIVDLDYASEEVIGSRIELFDVLGKQILTKVVESTKTPISMNVVPGTYVVKITKVSGEVHTEKVIVK